MVTQLRDGRYSIREFTWREPAEGVVCQELEVQPSHVHYWNVEPWGALGRTSVLSPSIMDFYPESLECGETADKGGEPRTGRPSPRVLISSW